MSKLAAALAWAARGFRIFPIVENSKRPVFDDFPARATDDAGQITEWWRDRLTGHERDYNIGVSTTGAAVLDLDTKNGRQGVASFFDLGGEFDTLTVATPSGGFHLYYTAPRAVANSQGEAGGVAPGLDVRGHHGYVLAPGSVIDGVAYTVSMDLPLSEIPDTILARTRPPGVRSQGAVAPADLDTPASIAAVREYLDRAPPAIEGMGGNTRTYQTIARVRDLGLSEAMAADMIEEQYNPRCEPPWSADDLRALVTNAYAYAQNPAGSKSADTIFGGVSIPEPQYVVETPPERREGLYWGNAPRTADLVPRPWVVNRLLMAGEVTALIATGGVGKSMLTLAVGAMLAQGHDVWGYKNAARHPRKMLIYNAEDDRMEMGRRLAALCAAMNYPESDVLPHLLLWSGKDDGRLQIAQKQDGTLTYRKDDVQRLIALCSQSDVAVIAVDPLAKLHIGLNENDNSDMTFLMDGIERLAAVTQTAVLVSHHTAKPGAAASGAYAGNSDSSRGAGAIINSARIAVTLSSPTTDDKTRYHLSDEDANRFVRLDDAKNNRALKMAAATWLKKVSIRLVTGDDTGALVAADLEAQGAHANAVLLEVLEAHMTTKGIGSLTTGEAITVLMDNDPILGLLPTASVKAKIEMLLLGSDRIRAVSEKGRRLLTLN